MDIQSIAKEVVNEYAEGLRYIDGVNYANITLFIALDENFNATPSTSSTILTDAYQAVIILGRNERAEVNYYTWFSIRFIDHNGVVYDSFNIEDWTMNTTIEWKYTDQIIQLKYKGELIIKRELLTDKWIDNVKVVFDFFSVLRTATTEEERKWMIKYLYSNLNNEKLDAKNILLEKQVCFLESQVKKYTKILDRLEVILSNNTGTKTSEEQ